MLSIDDKIYFKERYQLKEQSHQGLVLLENPMKMLVLTEKPTNSCLILLKRTVLVTKIV